MAAKIFEVGDVLPATTQLRVHFNGGVNAFEKSGYLTSDSNNFYFIVEDNLIFSFNDGDIYFEIYNYDEEIWVSPFNETTHNYMDIDISSWSLSKRTISNVDDCPFTWEDLALPSIPANIADKLLQINKAKQDIKVALENKNIDLTGVKFSVYAEKIDVLPAVVELTQAQYDAIVIYDNNTYYLIVEE